MKELFSAGIVLFYMKNDQPHYLLLYYPHGHWDLPKGKIESGESKEQAALRELKEETGLAATIIDGFETEISYMFRERDELIKKTVFFFIGKASSDAITLSHEHVDFDWLPYDQAIEKLTFDNAREVLKKANDFILR